jgi:hypothetical protein
VKIVVSQLLSLARETSTPAFQKERRRIDAARHEEASRPAVA